jgi:RHS repeat-associated protein
MNIHRFLPVSVCAAVLLVVPSSLHAAPGEYWLQNYSLQWWEWDLDMDGDGYSNRSEYHFGTHPRSLLSAPPVPRTMLNEANLVLSWPTRPGIVYSLQQAPSLGSWMNFGLPIPGDGNVVEAAIPLAGERAFFRLAVPLPADADGDGLSAVEEGLLGTNAALPDTDGDSLGDGTEVLQTFTNPHVAEPAGGTITGVVRTDPNRDGNTADGVPIEAVTMWLDSDYDGELDATEPRTATNAAGAFTFLQLPPGFYHVRQFLEPGNTQTQPAEVTPPVLDGWPDELVSYVHSMNGASFPGPYGFSADRLWPGTRWVLIGQTLESVDPALILKPAENRYEVPPIGIYNTTDMLAIPADGSVTVRFAENIVDLPGDDFAIIRPVQGSSSEVSEVWLGATADSLQFYGNINQNTGGSVLGLDLTDGPVRPPLRFVKIISRSSGGVDLGAAFTAIQALHFTGTATDARAVTIVGTETVGGVDFGRFFLDQPPVVLLEDGGVPLRQGVTSPLRLSAVDDQGITTRTASANGQALSVAPDGTFSVTPALAGVLEITGSATDTGGQTTIETWTLYVANPDGTLPFDPSTLGAAGDDGAPGIRVFSPASGAVVAVPTPVIATIAGPSAPVWQVAYAPVALVNPYDLETEDPDYIPLAGATGYRTAEQIAVFPGDTVADGIYFLRIKATPSAGGPTQYFGQVIAKGVPAESLQPRITITSPNDNTLTGLVRDVLGSIESNRPLTEWFVEVAPRAEVDLNDLGSALPNWRRLASGTAVVSPATLLARLDTSTLPNGPYVLRVVAWNDLRLGRVEARVVEVTGESKPGRHRREFTDVSLDLAGFPLTLQRVFDSFESGKVGDFGYGWSLALVNPQIGETVPRTGSGIVGQTAYRDGTRIYISGPDGKRNGFTFHPQLVSAGVFGANYRATFTPDAGVYDKLEVPEGATPFLTVAANGDVKLNFIGLAWNPDTFILVRPDGARYTYHETRGFVEAEDLNGNRLTYDVNGFKHSGGMALAIVRDLQGRIISVNAGGSRTWTYAYSAAGDLKSVTDPDGYASTCGYLANPAHYLASITDAFGRTGSAYEYGPDGRLTAIVDADGNRALQSWDPLGFTGTLTDGRGHATLLTYNQRGNVLTATDPLGGVTTFAYGDSRNPDRETSVTDPLNRVTAYTYDAAGNRTSTVRPGNIFAWETVTWNSQNNPLQIQRSDRAGFVENWQYDTAGNTTQELIFGQPLSTATYTAQGQIQTLTVAGMTTRAEYDPATGHQREITDPNGFRVAFTRNAAGELTGTTTAGGENVTTVNGSDGLPRSLTDAAGASATTVVNPDGSLTVNDWNGRNSRFYRNGAGEVTAFRGQDGFTITPERDANGNVTAMTGPLGNRHELAYDWLNRPQRYTDPAGSTRHYTYDAAGRFTEVTDRNGRKKRFTYNGLDQITQEQWLDSGGAVVRTWSLTYAANLNYGRLEAISDGQASWSFTGSAARPTRITVAYPGQTAFAVNYTWTDDAGSVPTQVRLIRGAEILHTIGAQIIGNRIYRHTWDAPNLTGGTSRHVRHHFDAMGGETRLERYASFINSDINQTPFAVTRTTRDTKGRATQIRHATAADVLLFPQSTMNLTRSPGGCIMSVVEPGNTADLSYDAGLQLTGVSHTSSPAENYGYDAAGNRLTSHFQPVAATIGVGNRVLVNGDLSLDYDFEGNLIRETTTSTGAIREFAYDHNNQLILVQTRASAGAPPVVVAQFAYDYAGNMMSRAEGGITTWVLYDRAMPVAEFRSGETAMRSIHFYQLDRLDRWFATWDADGGERWFLQDHRDSIRGVIRNDATPVVWADYDAFGRLISGDPGLLGSVRFTGRQWNEAASLYDYRARHYSPELGRFVQEDPSQFESGDLNLQRYAKNDPFNFTDPTGKTVATEYAVLACEVSVNALKEGGEIGACIARMIGSATLGLYGFQSGDGAACVLKKWANPWATVSSTAQTTVTTAAKIALEKIWNIEVLEPGCDLIK